MSRATFIYDLLDRFGYQEDVWVDLRDLSMIVLNRDANLFIDSRQCMYKFNSTVKLLEIAYGKFNEDHTEFTDLTGYNDLVVNGTSSFTPNEFLDYDSIMTIPAGNILLPGGYYVGKPFK